MKNKTINTEQGHWILATMGKKVLRPGGKELTLKLISALNITDKDAIVEFAPGMGYTASFILKKNPKSYIGIELNEEAANRLKKLITDSHCTIVNTNAANSGLAEASVDKVIGEAMLTMQADHRKAEIIGEAYRILKKGGLYGVHELGLIPNELDPNVKGDIQKRLAEVIKVNARPLTENEWCTLLKKKGFNIKQTFNSPMHLLEPKRILDDEGLINTLKIGYNIFTHPTARRKIKNMRNIFRQYEPQLNAFAIIAEK